MRAHTVFKPKDTNDPKIQEYVQIFRSMIDTLSQDPKTYTPKTEWGKDLYKKGITPGLGQAQIMDIYYKYFLKIENIFMDLTYLFDEWIGLINNKFTEDVIPLLDQFIRDIYDEAEYVGIKKLL